VLARASSAADALPWSPFLASDGRVVWVERAATSSRLVAATPPTLGDRRILWEVPGVLLRPVAVPGGVLVCSDHTGVFNAWRVALDGGAAVALTNTLGGVIAAVPSPDGTRLAVIDHDHDGPFLGLMPMPEGGPVAELGPIPRPPPQPREEAARGVAVTTSRGDGFHDLGWIGITPTSQASVGGDTNLVGDPSGTGIQALFGDPMQRSRLLIGMGFGDENEAIGVIRYSSMHLAPVTGAIEGHRHTSTYGEILPGGEDYHETITGGRLEIGTMLGLGLAVGADRHRPLEERDRLRSLASPIPAFAGNDHYVEAIAGIDTRTEYPLSVGPENGLALRVEFRHSGLGGDLDRNRALADLEGTVSVWPEAGHQLVARTLWGWSDGDSTLQGAFATGGETVTSLPILRGYPDVEAVGSHAAGWSVAYRLPLWRPEFGVGTQPWFLRQFVLEGFADAAKVSADHAYGDGRWYRSAGGQLSFDMELWKLRIAPGVVVARQIDGDEETHVSFALGGGFGF
jgi:hypothetical protein